ncbi:MAG: DUF1295 domain-containing protein [Longimicrobiales bacterium]
MTASALLGPALWGFGAVLAASTALWIVSVVRKDASIVDPFWAPGFLLVTGVYLARTGGSPRGWLVCALVAVWAVRLGGHLVRRNLAEGEDARYAAWRDEHGPRYWWVSLFTVFWLQASILWVVSAPLLASVAGGGPLDAWAVVGAVVALGGITLEAVADAQLRAFKERPDSAGTVLDSGLWRYSRHPNYFGNAVLWWGLWMVAVGVGAWWTAVGPAVMTLLLLRVSGVTLLERRLTETRPGYEAYVRRTSAFVPWPPRDRDPPGGTG